MKTKTSSTLAALFAALLLTACGGTKDAYAVCSSHQGVDEQTWEDDGDVLCLDGYEYEGDGDFEHAGYYKKHKKGSKPILSPAAKARIKQQVQTFKAKQAAKKASKPSTSSGGSSGSSSKPKSSKKSGGKKK